MISVVDLGLAMIEEGHPQSDEFQKLIEDLQDRWAELLAAVQARKDRLELSELTQQVWRLHVCFMLSMVSIGMGDHL